MTILATIRFEREGEDQEYKAEFVSVPAKGDFLSIGSLARMYRFQVMTVWHSHLDDESEVTLYCRELTKREYREQF